MFLQQFLYYRYQGNPNQAISCTRVGYKQQLAVPDTDPFEPLEKEYRLSILEPQDDTSSTSTEGSSDEASKVARGFLIPAKLGINRLRVTEVQTGRHGLRLVHAVLILQIRAQQPT